ncbi:MAG: HEAT repeat domain-containing protein [Myxococcales bacterium]|nr:HEAT repeat domain-containing protein [Myxococcales bacterium]MDH3483404.1 HEAT repeat domain-containing protein [Myxococcales bacterium]
MGLFDVFKGGGGGITKHVARVANKRAQQHERWESIQVLAADGSEEALRALLTRFTVRVDPSITDGEEKNAAFQGIVQNGDAAIGPVRDFLEAADTLAWPLKILRELQTEEEVTATLIELLSKMDTEYERDPQKKIDVIASLEERNDPRIVGAVTRFLRDMNETARFHAVCAIFAQPEAEEAIEALNEALLAEESVRVRMMILDGFVERDWRITESKDEVLKKLPTGYSLGKKGEVRKRQ